MQNNTRASTRKHFGSVCYHGWWAMGLAVSAGAAGLTATVHLGGWGWLVWGVAVWPAVWVGWDRWGWTDRVDTGLAWLYQRRLLCGVVLGVVWGVSLGWGWSEASGRGRPEPIDARLTGETTQLFYYTAHVPPTWKPGKYFPITGGAHCYTVAGSGGMFPVSKERGLSQAVARVVGLEDDPHGFYFHGFNPRHSNGRVVRFASVSPGDNDLPQLWDQMNRATRRVPMDRDQARVNLAEVIRRHGGPTRAALIEHNQWCSAWNSDAKRWVETLLTPAECVRVDGVYTTLVKELVPVSRARQLFVARIGAARADGFTGVIPEVGWYGLPGAERVFTNTAVTVAPPVGPRAGSRYYLEVGALDMLGVFAENGAIKLTVAEARELYRWTNHTYEWSAHPELYRAGALRVPNAYIPNKTELPTALVDQVVPSHNLVGRHLLNVVDRYRLVAQPIRFEPLPLLDVSARPPGWATWEDRVGLYRTGVVFVPSDRPVLPFGKGASVGVGYLWRGVD